LAEDRAILHLMLDFFRLILGLIADMFRSRASLETEVLALGQQINVLQRLRSKRPTLSSMDRRVLGWICRWFPNACDALAIVRPETVLRWHRAGFLNLLALGVAALTKTSRGVT
jgi:hypothetical protein